MGFDFLNDRPARPRGRVRVFRCGRPAWLLCGAAAAVVLVGGCGDGDGGEGAATSPPAATATGSPRTEQPGSPGGTGGTGATGNLTGDRAERQALVSASKVGYGQAVDDAVAEVDGGKLVDIELDRGRGSDPVWEAKVAAPDGTVHEVTLDAVSGDVLRSQEESGQSDDDRKEVTDLITRAEVSPDEAGTTATGRKKGGRVIGAELDHHDGREDHDGQEGQEGRGGGNPVWKVEVVTPGDWNLTTYDIDAVSGDVLSESVDRD
ncbi:PepSY domain-containing protein [Streptomyces sp. NPDC059506]|uniref:PepSY domain-containing protein n=1 Tax=Streptomyces sp. NPDC059506 TaxID=3347751 RepID=UPI0036AF494A